MAGNPVRVLKSCDSGNPMRKRGKTNSAPSLAHASGFPRQRFEAAGQPTIMIELTTIPIDFNAVTDSVRSHNAGAVVLFLGTVREFTDGAQTASLEYEAYSAMAVQAMEQLRQEARDKWTLVNASIVHRIGQLELGEIAVAVAVSSAHRTEAFEAGQWLIDTLKHRVPIWKKEQYTDGQTEWVHPTQKSDPSAVPPSSPPPSAVPSTKDAP